MIWGAIFGGLAGTLVLTTVLRAASELGLTRINLPFLLGTAVSADRIRAKAIGYALHFLFGLLFALGYYAVFVVIDRSGFLLGGLFGPLLEPPGFMLVNYGSQTPLATIVAHVAYGAIVGGFTSLTA